LSEEVTILSGEKKNPIRRGSVARPPASLWYDAWARLRRNKAAMVAIAVIVIIVLMAIFAGQVAPYHYAEQDMLNTWGTPDRTHLLGTDGLGRDILSRLIYGTRISMSVAFVTVAIILTIGVPLGLLSGYFGGWWDHVIMRFVDVMYAFPDLLLIIIVMTFVKGSLAQSGSA